VLWASSAPPALPAASSLVSLLLPLMTTPSLPSQAPLNISENSALLVTSLASPSLWLPNPYQQKRNAILHSLNMNSMTT
jgi:hypothetical protein